MPTYLKIADAIAKQIAAGALAPGTRVPSTRLLVAREGIAMATASKALAELRRRGLVRVVSGVGTVVAGPTRRPAGEETVGDSSIVVAACRVADAEGLDAVTMRRVAAELDTAPMSLYRHVGDKEDLLLRMREWVFGLHPLPPDPPRGWRAQLEHGARHLWALYRMHPWLARTPSITRPSAEPNQIAYSEWPLRALRTLGLQRQAVFDLHLALFNLVHGTAASLETESRELAESGQEPTEWMRAQEERALAVINSGAFPHSAAVFSANDIDAGLDHLFEVGLSLMLDGIAVRVGRSRAQR